MKESSRIFARHPRLAILTIVLTGTILILLAAELSLRTFGSLDIGYYTGLTSPGVHKYPYGDIPINAAGCPDEEFDPELDPDPMNRKRRIGYFGDSVTYGVGAGYGYRIPDLLQREFPQYDHWVFAGVGTALHGDEVARWIRKFQLNAVVYMMNLNDITPERGDARGTNWITAARGSRLVGMDEALRGRSYVYTYARLGVKNALQRMGYEGATGLQAFELFPEQYKDLIEVAADDIAATLDAVSRQFNVRTCVIVLPYEMQVSRDAARRYRAQGFKWEEGFEAGSTQRQLMARFQQHHISAFDALEAFKGLELRVGDAFVYDRGDKIDWNHPNRRGHAIIAGWLASSKEYFSLCLDRNEDQ